MLGGVNRGPRGANSRIAARDAGLERVSALTRWLGVSALGLVGLLAGYVWQSKPGHSTGQHAGTSAPTLPPGPVPKLDTGGEEALAPPPQPPLAAAPPATVSSGGS
jgi:hypothetical protein